LKPILHRGAWRVLALAALPTLLLALAGCGEEPPRERRMQTVKLLPDTPPPPPPPPKEKPPEAPKEDKPQPQAPVNKPEPEQQAALKSDEAAGDGPGSGLVAGAVTQDYSDQKIGQQPQIGGGTGLDAAARLAATSFATATTRSLNDFLARERELKRADFRAQVHLWLAPNGTLERAELVGSTGDADKDRALREALQRFPGAAAPLPQALQQPLRVQVTNRMLG
jgi:periplasmic protein TonB